MYTVENDRMRGLTGTVESSTASDTYVIWDDERFKHAVYWTTKRLRKLLLSDPKDYCFVYGETAQILYNEDVPEL